MQEGFNEIKEAEMGTRPSWDEYFISQAILISSRSSCLNVRSGSVIVLGNRIIGTGYNGAPANIKNCLDNGCAKANKGLSYSQSLNSGHCIGIHSEMNALAHLTILNKEAILYTTILPCVSCAKNLVGYGIKRIIFMNFYDGEETNRSLEIFKQAGVVVDRLRISSKRFLDIIFNHKCNVFDVWSDKEKIEVLSALVGFVGNKSI